jgi:hypothetical protein
LRSCFGNDEIKKANKEVNLPKIVDVVSSWSRKEKQNKGRKERGSYL